MKTYRVWLEVKEERYIDVQARSKEEARRLAEEIGADNTHASGESQWRIFAVQPRDTNWED
jgi:hypothetical protein